MPDNNYASILVPLDGSEFAEQVLPQVMPIAARFGSRLTLLQVTTSPAAMAPLVADPMAAADGMATAAQMLDPEIFEAEKQRAVEYLSGVAKQLHAQGLATVEIEHVEGTPAEIIARRAKELGVSLIAMTTHGRGGLGRLMFGSVADAVLRDAPCPVLLVRVSEEQPPGTKN